MNIINNFILGTAQFGSNYGVGSLKGNLYDSNKSIKLLQNAYKMGIRSLDTTRNIEVLVSISLYSTSFYDCVNVLSKP